MPDKRNLSTSALQIAGSIENEQTHAILMVERMADAIDGAQEHIQLSGEARVYGLITHDYARRLSRAQFESAIPNGPFAGLNMIAQLIAKADALSHDDLLMLGTLVRSARALPTGIPPSRDNDAGLAFIEQLNAYEQRLIAPGNARA